MHALARLLPAMCVLLAACGGPEEEAPRQGPRPEPVVVYASHDDAAYWPGLFAGFTRETGIRVTVKHGDADRIVADVIAKRGSPPADVLLTPGVAGMWRAADEGALLPLASEPVKQLVPTRFRDSDGYWTAVSYRTAQIVFDGQLIAPGEVVRYEDLALPKLKGRLCLSSSALAVNRSVIAMLIKSHGARPAEIIVRGWVANLAIPPLDSEAKLMRSIEAGTCAIGIVSAPAAQLEPPHDEQARIARITPAPAFVDAEAVGINRHAREPDAALQLIEWMLTPEFQTTHSTASRNRPIAAMAAVADRGEEAAGSDIATVGSFDEDAVSLAERARYR